VLLCYYGYYVRILLGSRPRWSGGLATEPTGHSVAGSNPTEGGGFLWVIKIPSTHFLWRGSKAVGPMS
jgi:hypothetical protein